MYHTTNELNHFDFEEAIFDELEFSSDGIRIFMENVKILPENSCNRDIRLMRTNDMELDLVKGSFVRIVKEGYKRFNADGVLLESVEDEIIPAKEHSSVLKELIGTTIYSLEQENDTYILNLDTDDGCYVIEMTAIRNEENWERFLNL